MYHKPRSLRISRPKRCAVHLPESLEERRLLAGDGGSIWLDAFEDWDGNGVYDTVFEDSAVELPGMALYRDDGDGVLNTAVDQEIAPTSTRYGTSYEDLEFGRYFGVAPDYQFPFSSRTVLTTPAVQEFEITADSLYGYAEFGYWYTGISVISIYFDANANAIRDEGESLVEGEITLHYGESDLNHVVTIHDGMTLPWWGWDGSERHFSIGKNRADGLVTTTPDPLTVVYEAGVRKSIEIGVVQGSSIRAAVFSDTTGDGRTEDDTLVNLGHFASTEAKIHITGQAWTGQTVDIITPSYEKPYLEPVVKDLLPGSYRAELVLEGDREFFSTESLVRNFEVGINEEIYIDFSVFLAEPVKDELEVGNHSDSENFAGVTVELFRDNGDGVLNPQIDTLVAQDVTDSKGRYDLPKFGPGEYFLVTRIGDQYTAQELADAKPFTAKSHEKPLPAKLPLGRVSGWVFVDENQNGVFEPRERPLSKVKFKIEGTDVFGNSFSREGISDYTGRYHLYALRPGTYTITQEQPAGYQDGAITLGALGSKVMGNKLENIIITDGTFHDGFLFREHGSPGLRESRPNEADHIGVFNPQESFTYLSQSNTTGTAWAAFPFGPAGSQPVVGNWRGYFEDNAGVFEPATGLFRLKNTNSSGADDDVTPFIFGGPGFVAIAGDWDGDGKDSVGVYDPVSSSFYLRNSTDSGIPDAGQFIFGRPGWVPLAGDWDGDGRDGIGVYDPATATFYLRNTLTAGAPDYGPINYGMPGWKPIAGDWDDDHIVTIGAYNPDTATFFLRNSNSTGVADVDPFNFGLAGWEPIVGDWNTLDAATTRPYVPSTGSGVTIHAPIILVDDSAEDPIEAYLRRDSAGLDNPVATGLSTENEWMATLSSALTYSADPQSPLSVSNFNIAAAETHFDSVEDILDENSLELIEELALDQLTG